MHFCRVSQTLKIFSPHMDDVRVFWVIVTLGEEESSFILYLLWEIEKKALAGKKAAHIQKNLSTQTLEYNKFTLSHGYFALTLPLISA